MTYDVLQFADNPYPTLANILVGVALGVMAELFLSRMRRRVWGNRKRWNNQSKCSGARFESGRVPQRRLATNSKPDAADQLRIVMGAEFTVQPLLNRDEIRVFRELGRIVIDHNPGWQVMAQVSVGEIVRSKDANAYSCINSKRVDLLLVDEDCRPRHAIEYQGAAHHQAAAAARDAVKKEALRPAGIGYHEVLAGSTTPSDLRRLVERLLNEPASAQ